MQISSPSLSNSTLALVLLCSVVFVTLGVIGNQAFSATAEPRYVDHLRHQRYAWEFIDSRFDIVRVYRTPMKDLPRPVTWDGHIWIDSSYAYPLGALLFFAPFAFDSYNFQPIAPLVSKSPVLLLLLKAHLDTYVS